ncbi:MAG: hypothetical protein FD170_2924 [Bacteroidetes bacterium]|nr:MAG: hypothetical protein FD170_2924 [Bacteroidota bacterium]
MGFLILPLVVLHFIYICNQHNDAIFKESATHLIP